VVGRIRKGGGGTIIKTSPDSIRHKDCELNVKILIENIAYLLREDWINILVIVQIGWVEVEGISLLEYTTCIPCSIPSCFLWMVGMTHFMEESGST
jgi:hypothetical protein